MTLYSEFQWYVQNQSELVRKFDGKVLAIKNKALLGVFESYGEAYIESAKAHPAGSFLLQKCSPGSKDYTPNFRKNSSSYKYA